MITENLRHFSQQKSVFHSFGISPDQPMRLYSPIERRPRAMADLGLGRIFKHFSTFTQSPHSRSACPKTPGTRWETVVYTKNSNRLSLIDSPMADSPIERRPRGMADLGLSRIFKHFSTFTQSHHTRGVYVPRPQERNGRQSFSPKIPTARRSSTPPWRIHPSSGDRVVWPIWDLVEFSNIFQLLHRVTTLEEYASHDPRKIVVFTKHSNGLTLIDSPMAGSPMERRSRAIAVLTGAPD